MNGKRAGCLCPREQYERSYVLLPPTADGDWVAAAGWATEDFRFTIGYSADDAGIGPEARVVYAVNPDDWDDDLFAWFATHYPGVVYWQFDAESPADLGVQLCPPLEDDIALSQNDEQWADVDLGECPGGETIGQAGCLLCCLAMMLRREYAVDIRPPLLNKLLAQSGVPFVHDDLLMWHDAIRLFGAFNTSRKDNFQPTSHGLAQMLDEGWAVALARHDYKHFVYLERVEGQAFHVIDPWDGRRKTWGMYDAGGIRAAQRC